LIISDEEADSAPQRRDYKVVTDDEISQVKWDRHKPVMGQVINSAVGYPYPGEKISGHTLELRGWAHGDGWTGTQATKVELSFDSGKTWQNVPDLLMEDKPKGMKVFSWTLWCYKLDISRMRGACSVQVRATDSTGRV